MKKLLIIFLLCLVTTSAFAQFQQKPMLGVQINRAHQLGDFVGAWFFLEGSGNKVFDLSGNKITSVFYGDPTWVSGQFGSALHLDGSGDYVEMPLPSSLSAELPITVIIKARRVSGTNLKGLFNIQGASGTTGQILMFYYESSTGISISHKKILSYGAVNSSSIVPSDWNVYAVTNAGGNVKCSLFVNGVDLTGGDSPDRSNYGTNIIDIGRAYTGYDADVEVEYVYIYNRVLSAFEFALLYREPFCMFQKDDIAMMAVEAPAPGGGQVIFIQTAKIVSKMMPLWFLFLIPSLIFIKRRKCQQR